MKEKQPVNCELLNQKFEIALGYWQVAPQLAAMKNVINGLLKEASEQRLDLILQTEIGDFHFSPTKTKSGPTRRVLIEDVWGSAAKAIKKKGIHITRGKIDSLNLVIMAKERGNSDFYHQHILRPREIYSIAVRWV